MDSDEEVTEHDILDWYTGRVNEIWETAADSFTDLDANMAAVFREVMDSVQRRSRRDSNESLEEAETQPSTSNEQNSQATMPVTVTMTPEQLMSVLEDDDDWLDTADENEGENPITVKLSDEKTKSEETLPKNVKGASHQTSSVAGSKSLFCSFFRLAFCIVKLISLTILGLVSLYLLSTVHNPTQKILTRQIQDYIYPTMRALRLATLTWIEKYPSLSDWHEETCLVSNPWYWTRPLDCSSCRDLETSAEIANSAGTAVDNFATSYYHSGRPFIVKEPTRPSDTLEKLQKIYASHKSIFSRGIARFKSSNPRFKNLTDVVENLASVRQLNDLHVSWRISRMGAARLLRQLFPRPHFIPLDTEVALHKYLFIDGSRSSPYRLPTTEFANVWIVQGQGQRTVNLKPSPSCKEMCKEISIEISHGDILFYNWQFWEVFSQPVESSDETSITYVGSFY